MPRVLILDYSNDYLRDLLSLKLISSNNILQIYTY